MQTAGWTQGVTLRVLGIGFLALLMFIPLLQVQGLIGEREGLEREARSRIAERWGGEQVVGGPVLAVPVRTQVRNDKGFTSVDHRHSVLPDVLRIPLSEPLFILGALFILVVMFLPGGIAGTVDTWVRRRRGERTRSPLRQLADVDEKLDEPVEVKL